MSRARCRPSAPQVADDGAPNSAASAHFGCAPLPAAVRASAARGNGSKCPQLSPVSKLFLGMGDNSPDIYAIMRLRGCARLEDVAEAMQNLVDAHDRFRMRIVYRGGAWCTEVRRPRGAGRGLRMGPDYGNQTMHSLAWGARRACMQLSKQPSAAVGLENVRAAAARSAAALGQTMAPCPSTPDCGGV